MNYVINNMKFNFLYIDTYSFNKEWVFLEAVTPYSMLRYIESGSGTFFIDGEEISAEEGYIIYIPQGSRLSCYANTNHFVFTSIRFTTTVSFGGSDFLAEYYRLPKRMAASDEKQYFDNIFYWVRHEEAARMFFVRGNLEILIGTLISRNCEGLSDRDERENASDHINRLRAKQNSPADNLLDPRIQRVTDYITIHPTERFTPRALAEMAGLSKQRFSALFKQQVGKPPMTYVRELKLGIAARKLLVSADSVSEVAYEIGYNDPNYFIREFKCMFGYTPRQYRKVSQGAQDHTKQ